MQIHRFISKTTLLATAMVVLASGALRAQPHGDQFVGTIVNMEGGGTAPVVIHIDHYSSDQEIANLKGVLAAKGPDALRDALWDLEAGYIRVKGGLGYPVAAARSKSEAGGRVIRLMIDRPISFREEANSLRSSNYPFSYVELHLDASGKGDGKFIAAAKVTLDVNNTVEIESLGVQPFKLLDVHSSR